MYIYINKAYKYKCLLLKVSEVAEGVVVGSAIIANIDANLAKSPQHRAKALKEFISTLSNGIIIDCIHYFDICCGVPLSINVSSHHYTGIASRDSASFSTAIQVANPDHVDIESRSFGDFGGRYIPETLVEAHRDLEEKYAEALADPAFLEEVAFYRKEFIGGPTPLYFAKRLTEKVGGAKIWFKREEMAHTGAHKINNAVGQALLAKRVIQFVATHP